VKINAAANANLEIEVKFLISDLQAIRSRILAVGAILERKRVFEGNILFDTIDRRLETAGNLLRVRVDDRQRMTFKVETLFPDEVVKVREEMEIEVSDFDICARILQRLGYHPVWEYEKYRETFRLDQVEIVVDELPYGNFIEIEGPKEEIVATAKVLQLPWEHRILKSYLGLLTELNDRSSSSVDNLTFEAFEEVSHRVNDIRTACQ